MDLEPYIAKGFPGDFDRMIAEVSVSGIDRQQTLGQVRVCPQTEALLYEGDYSPTGIAYQRGARPQLESITAAWSDAEPWARAQAAADWVFEHVLHPHLVAPLPPNRAMTEEQIIGSGVGWCNEQARVFIALCEVTDLPARLCFVYHDNGKAAHSATEVLLDGRWCYFDQTFNICVTLADGALAEGRQLSGPQRDLAHLAYEPVLRDFYQRTKPFVEDAPGWCQCDRPTPDRGGDLLHALGICNYLIDGAVEQE